MPGEVITAFEQKFGTRIVEGYGLPKTSHQDFEQEAAPSNTPARARGPQAAGGIGLRGAGGCGPAP